MKAIQYFLVFVAGCCFSGVAIAVLLLAYGAHHARLDASPTQNQAVVEASAVSLPQQPTLAPTATYVPSTAQPTASTAPILPTEAVVQVVGPTYDAVCMKNEDRMTDAQLSALANQYVGQTFAGWRTWVYDVVAKSNGTYDLLLSMNERSIVWSRDIEIANIPQELALSFNVGQMLYLSGKIARSDDAWAGLCNPLVIDSYILQLPGVIEPIASYAPVASMEPVEPVASVDVAPTVMGPTALPPAESYNRYALYNHYMVGDARPKLPPVSNNDFDVMILAQEGAVLPLFIRNNTRSAVSSIGVAAVAHTAGGNVLGATSIAVEASPNLVQPGEVAYAKVDFGSLTLPMDAQYEFEIFSSPAIGEGGYGDLTITQHGLVQGNYVGEGVNFGDEGVALIRAQLLCFDEAGTYLSYDSTYTAKGTAARGEAVPFQVGRYREQCPTYLLWVSGN